MNQYITPSAKHSPLPLVHSMISAFFTSTPHTSSQHANKPTTTNKNDNMAPV
ncbi:hypothetical protein BJ165DRAFT_1502977 [Panaeolus papilionaceus]|nr:hypothetical protein BJ165DRAFT_1502977 [Panaeolus papilionaceus]